MKIKAQKDSGNNYKGKKYRQKRIVPEKQSVSRSGYGEGRKGKHKYKDTGSGNNRDERFDMSFQIDLRERCKGYIQVYVVTGIKCPKKIC